MEDVVLTVLSGNDVEIKERQSEAQDMTSIMEVRPGGEEELFHPEGGVMSNERSKVEGVVEVEDVLCQQGDVSMLGGKLDRTEPG